MEGINMSLFNKITMNIVEKMVKHVIRKKIGADVDVDINGLTISEYPGETGLCAHIDANLRIGQDQLKELFKKWLE